jgi:hypothetical protein
MGLWFNTDGMSFDDLVKKETEVRKKLTTAFRVGVGQETMNQFYNVLDDIRLAMIESQFKRGDDDDEDDKDIFDDYLDIG